MRLLDASVVAKFALEEEGREEAKALAAYPLWAPELILAETVNAWWRASLRGALSESAFREAVGNLPSLFDRLLATEPVLERAAMLSVELRHPIYDCIYLAYAEQLRIPVITADVRLLSKVKTSGLVNLCEPLGS